MNRVLATAAILSLTLAPAAFAQSQPPQGNHPASTTSSGGTSKQSSETMRATPDQVKQIQAELKSQGLYKGRVDGEAGKQTMAALSSYQKSKGLPATGKIDQQTLDSLNGASGSSGSDSMGGTGASGATQQP
jgi:peptidoglycan hydrolase-like protein with peptidoglycan-binding domain